MKQKKNLLKTCKILYLSFFLLLCIQSRTFAQEDNTSDEKNLVSPISANIETRLNFFQKDSTIGAFNTPQYDKTLYSLDSWLNLNYQNWGFNFGLRFDVFNNSNLYSVRNSNTLAGIGYWQINKKIKKLDITAGYIYDQLGRGLIFRSYELRPLAIDNALVGLRFVFDLSENWKIKFLGGKQKNQLSTYAPVLKGGSIEGYLQLNKSGSISMAPGIAAIGRTWDDNTIQQMVSSIQLYHPADSLGIYYNTYAYTIYNTFTADNLTWYAEASLKSNDVLKDDDAATTQFSGGTSTGKFVDKKGFNYYASVNYTLGKFNLTLDGKWTNYFKFRIDPFEKTLNQGALNFLPPMSKQNSYALKNLYVPATQELGEKSAQAEIRYSLSDNIGINLSGSLINGRQNQNIYNETDLEFNYTSNNGDVLNAGIYRQYYDIALYQGKGGQAPVKTITPYIEILRKTSDQSSARVELSYLAGQGGYGSLMYGLIEYSLNPRWTLFGSDMWNHKPEKGASIHYFSGGVFYNEDNIRVSCAYIKQLEGVVCTGGICRIEPAFSGIRCSINANF